MRAAIWLMPQTSLQTRLDEEIADYAARHGRAPFRAHLTLAAGADAQDFSDARLSEFAAAHAPVALERDGVLRSEAFSRSFALKFRLSDGLQSLREAARDLLGVSEEAPFIPHLSLTYGAPPDEDALQQIAGALVGPILFDAVALCTQPDTIAEQADVADMRVGQRLSLG